jgi:hypothetical protein
MLDPPRVDVPPPVMRPASYAAEANMPPTHLYVRIGGQQKPLAAPYADTYLVASKGAKTFTIQVGQRQEIVSVDRLKAHTEGGISCRGRLSRPISQEAGHSHSPSCTSVVIYSQKQPRNSHKRALGGRPIK